MKIGELEISEMFESVVVINCFSKCFSLENASK
jgi:hypothetical protein